MITRCPITIYQLPQLFRRVKVHFCDATKRPSLLNSHQMKSQNTLHVLSRFTQIYRHFRVHLMAAKQKGGGNSHNARFEASPFPVLTHRMSPNKIWSQTEVFDCSLDERRHGIPPPPMLLPCLCHCQVPPHQLRQLPVLPCLIRSLDSVL